MTQTPPNYISFEAPKERLGRKTLATQESLKFHPNLRHAMAPPNLDQAALEVMSAQLQEALSSRRTVTAEQTTVLQVSDCCCTSCAFSRQPSVVVLLLACSCLLVLCEGFVFPICYLSLYSSRAFTFEESLRSRSSRGTNFAPDFS
jgi:hypothetical protein